MVQIHVSYLFCTNAIYVPTVEAFLWTLMVILDVLLAVRVCVVMWCLPECFSISWSEAWGDLSMCHLSRGANCGHSQVPCLTLLSFRLLCLLQNWRTQFEIALWFADGDILCNLHNMSPSFSLFLQAGCARSSATSQGHIVNGWAESRCDQGKHRGQKLCSHRSRCGSYHAWRLASATAAYHCTLLCLFPECRFRNESFDLSVF